MDSDGDHVGCNHRINIYLLDFHILSVEPSSAEDLHCDGGCTRCGDAWIVERSSCGALCPLDSQDCQVWKKVNGAKGSSNFV